MRNLIASNRIYCLIKFLWPIENVLPELEASTFYTNLRFQIVENKTVKKN